MIVHLYWQGVAESPLSREMPSCPDVGDIVRLPPDRPGVMPRFGRVVSRLWRISWAIEVDIILEPTAHP